MNDSEEKEQRIEEIRFLKQGGMDQNLLERYLRLQNEESDTREEQIYLLRKYRFEILDEIHTKQQYLDRLDFLIHEMKNKKSERKIV